MRLTLQTGVVVNNPTAADVRQALGQLNTEDCLYLMIEKSETERLRAFIEDSGYRFDYEDKAMDRAIYSEVVRDINIAHFILTRYVEGEADWFESVEWKHGQIVLEDIARGWVYFFCLWPLYLLFIGGAIGGAIGGFAAFTNFQVIRNQKYSYNLRLFLVALSGFWAFLVYAVLATWFLFLWGMIFG